MDGNFPKAKKPISFILMDIDYFKNINDEYGHLQGDYVLKEVAAILNRVSRKQDFACRWGGEEFIVMLTNTELEQAVDMAERIRGTIQQQRLKKMKSITASFGVTQWRQNDDEESVFKRLDNSLYLAKLTGRNKVVSNEELQLGYQGKPVSIDWGPFFRCGNRQLDEDHYKLISLANEIIDTCYKEHEKKTISLLFKGLIKDVIAHFAREESLLQQVHYEKVYEHKRVHESLLKGILLVLTKFEAGEITTRVAAQYLVQEIIIGHIIKKDSDFFYLFRSERGAVEIDNEIK